MSLIFITLAAEMEDTAHFIIEKVAPVFNKQGYIGTSLSDLTKVTGLTKGAIYGNFKDKEDLALKSFEHIVRLIITPLRHAMINAEGSINKLQTMVDHYRDYYKLSKGLGGCPLLNVGVDAQNNNPKLFEAAKNLGAKLYKGLSHVIKEGVENGELKKNINPEEYASNIYSMIEGSVFIAFTFGKEKNFLIMLDHIEQMIHNDMKN